MADAPAAQSCVACGSSLTTYAGSVERGSGIHTLWACHRHLDTVTAQARTVEDQEDFLLNLAHRNKPGRRPLTP
ncbi:hypothetical protein [Streptomyces sp. DW26H14]|uniref:hypothetical protein n=1 Tax=Streptomyces sp. DW26H14 TaxID=3435395 RepID=UPI00403DBC69